MPKRLNILDIWVDYLTRAEALQCVQDFVEKGQRPHAIFASNPEKNFTVPRDPLLYEVYRDADILLPDGIGVVMAARMLYGVKMARIPGSEFIFDICSLADRKGYKTYFYGAKEFVNREAVEKLKMMYPGMKIVGRDNGYIEPDSMSALISRINQSHAQILFIALGSPQQEKWYAMHKDALKTVRVCQGVGGTLDTIVGNVKRAPEKWCRLHMEWLYRLISEPKRIKRQKVLPLFALKVLSTYFTTTRAKNNCQGAFIRK